MLIFWKEYTRCLFLGMNEKVDALEFTFPEIIFFVGGIGMF